MKYLFFIFTLLAIGQLSAQESNQQAPQKLDGFLQSSLLDPLQQQTRLHAGKLFLLSQDGMPCVALEEEIVKSMPNGFKGETNIERSPIPYYYLPSIPETNQIAFEHKPKTSETPGLRLGRPHSTEELNRLLNNQKRLPSYTPKWARPGSMFK